MVCTSIDCSLTRFDIRGVSISLEYNGLIPALIWPNRVRQIVVSWKLERANHSCVVKSSLDVFGENCENFDMVKGA